MQTKKIKLNLRNWWLSLEPQWQIALNEGFYNKGKSTELPSEEELDSLYLSPALRLVGPKGPYPNLSFELSNLSGVEGLPNLEILVIGYHQVNSLDSLKKLQKLRSLFLFGNRLESLDGIQHLTELEDLYVNLNSLASIKAVEKLAKLKSLYCNYNKLTSLEGITKAHRGTLKQFVCLPNDELPDSEILRVENRLLIRCQKG